MPSLLGVVLALSAGPPALAFSPAFVSRAAAPRSYEIREKSLTEERNELRTHLNAEAAAAAEAEPAAAATTAGESEAWRSIPGSDLDDILSVAADACRAAGAIVYDNLGCCSKSSELCSTDSVKVKTNMKDVVTEFDTLAQEAVEAVIRGRYPDHTFLGEEDVDPGAAASEEALDAALRDSPSGYVWIVDPIDGTANFAAGLPFCAVTMGVVYRGTPIVGIVYDPHRDEMFTAIRERGAFMNGGRMFVASAVTEMSDAIINAGCPADPNAFDVSMRGMAALNPKSRGVRIVACSALTTAWIAAGRLSAHFGYDLSSWDLVAGALLIREAGGMVTDLDGSPYRIETRNMLCSNGLIHDEVLRALGEADAVSFVRAPTE